MKKLSWHYQAIFAVVFSLSTAGMEYALPFMYADWIRYLLMGLIALCMFGAAEIGIVPGLAVAITGSVARYFFEPCTMNFAIILGIANCLLVLCYWLLKKKRLLGVAVSTIVRFGFIYLIAEQVITRLDGAEGELTASVLGYWNWTYLFVPLVAGILYLVIAELMNGSLLASLKKKGNKDELTTAQGEGECTDTLENTENLE